MATPTQSRLTGRRRLPLLLPREHGAYGQLLFPLATVMVIGNGAPAALALGGACVMAFVAHEGLLTLLGHRGARAARARRRDALLSLIGCVVLALAAGAWALTRTSAAARISLGFPVASALLLIPFIWTRREHSTAAEITVAIGLSSCCVPVALAGGVPVARTVTCWFVFALAFVVATVTVRSVIASTRRTRATSVPPGPPTSRRSAPPGLLAVSAIVLSFAFANGGWIPWTAPFALLPVCGLAAALSLFPPHPRHLRTVGWLLVTATAATSAVLAVAFA